MFSLVMCSLILAACGPAVDSESCIFEDDNYLSDPDFSQEALSSRSRHWTSIQHTGEKSYAVSIDGGVLSVEKIGSQPWFLFRQRMDAEELEGRTVGFSADVRLIERADAPAGHFDQPGGLKLSALAAGKSQLQIDRRLEAGGSPQQWQRLQIVVQVPRYTETLELSFVHESDGVLQVQNPSLRLVSPGSEGCLVATGDKVR